MFSISGDLYDAIYSFKNYAAEADKIRTLIRTSHPAAKTILDVACGTGEHAKYLSAQFQVDGIDLNPDFLKLAQSKNPNGNFFIGDMRRFQLEKRYDVVQCLFSSIGYMLMPDDIVAALKCFGNHVTPDGIILVEPWLSPEAYVPGAPHMTTVDRPDLKICRMNLDVREGDVSILHFYYLIGTRDGIQQVEEIHKMALVAPDQMASHFQSAGLQCTFDPVGIFGRGLFIARQNRVVEP
jgi:SAM-dependent methyltransferase